MFGMAYVLPGVTVVEYPYLGRCIALGIGRVYSVLLTGEVPPEGKAHPAELWVRCLASSGLSGSAILLKLKGTTNIGIFRN